MDFTNDVLIYTAIKGEGRSRTRNTTGTTSWPRNPNVTVWTGATEAPDETALGDWMQLVATWGCSGTRRSGLPRPGRS